VIRELGYDPLPPELPADPLLPEPVALPPVPVPDPVPLELEPPPGLDVDPVAPPPLLVASPPVPDDLVLSSEQPGNARPRNPDTMTTVANEIPFRMVSSFPSGLTVTLDRFKSNAYAMTVAGEKSLRLYRIAHPETGGSGGMGGLGNG
jgi:hypothetical protein